MRAPMVVKRDPVTDHSAGMLQGFEAMPEHALLLQRSDHTLHHAVLLWAVRRDEFLLQTAAANQRRVAPTREDQAIVGSQ